MQRPGRKASAVFKTRRRPREPGRPQFPHESASVKLIFTSQFEPAPTAHAMVYDAQPEIAETSGGRARLFWRQPLRSGWRCQRRWIGESRVSQRAAGRCGSSMRRAGS